LNTERLYPIGGEVRNKMSLSDYGKEHNLTDEELIEYAKKNLAMDEEDIRLMLTIERGEVDGDVIEIP
jgi:hypothetical protein